MIFHQPRFSRNKEIFLPQLPFGARSREVATIWSDIKSYPLCPNIFPNWIQKQRLETPTKIEKTHGWGFWSAVKAQQRKYQEIRFIHGSTNSWPRKKIIFVLHQFPSYLGILGGCFSFKKTANLTWFSCVQSCFFVRYHQVPALFQNTILRCDIGLAFCDTLE